MSGIYIHGMEMPTDDKAIHIEIHSNGIVIAWRYGESDKIVGKTIPVPNHGRLVDADALIVDLMDRGIEGIQTDDWHEIQQAVMDAPTIIPAEEGE